MHNCRAGDAAIQQSEHRRNQTSFNTQRHEKKTKEKKVSAAIGKGEQTRSRQLAAPGAPTNARDNEVPADNRASRASDGRPRVRLGELDASQRPRRNGTARSGGI